jgi:hypothetical protein
MYGWECVAQLVGHTTNSEKVVSPHDCAVSRAHGQIIHSFIYPFIYLFTPSAQIHVFAIGVGLSDVSELRAIGRDELSVWTAERYSELSDLSDVLLDRLCAHQPDSSGILMQDSPATYTGEHISLGIQWKLFTI